MPSVWHMAVKAFMDRTKGPKVIPKRGTPEHAEIMRLYEKIQREMSKLPAETYKEATAVKRRGRKPKMAVVVAEAPKKRGRPKKVVMAEPVKKQRKVRKDKGVKRGPKKISISALNLRPPPVV